MHAIDAFPVHVILAALLWLLADSALWQGIRGVIVEVSVAELRGGTLFASTGLLVRDVIFLGEELYETGVVLLALRAGQLGLWA
jgi:hypothetical protein